MEDIPVSPAQVNGLVEKGIGNQSASRDEHSRTLRGHDHGYWRGEVEVEFQGELWIGGEMRG